MAKRQGTFDDCQVRGEMVTSCTQPIYGRNKYGRLTLIGSGVLLRYGSLYCTASAAHVLCGGGERWLGGEHSRISLSGVFHIGGDPNAPPMLKAIDLALSPLSARAVTILGNRWFLTMTDIDTAAPTPGALYYAVGYAWRDRRRPFGEGEPLRSKWRALGGKASPAERYRDRGVSEATGFLLDFDREHTEGRNGTGPAPKLNGMSGCGIWRFGDGLGPDRLAGLLIAYSERDKCIVASRMELLIDGLGGYVTGELAPA